MLLMAVARGLLLRRCNMLRTSGFMDDVMFLIVGPMSAWRHRSSLARCNVVYSLTPLANGTIRCVFTDLAS